MITANWYTRVRERVPPRYWRSFRSRASSGRTHLVTADPEAAAMAELMGLVWRWAGVELASAVLL